MAKPVFSNDGANIPVPQGKRVISVNVLENQRGDQVVNVILGDVPEEFKVVLKGVEV